MCVFVIVNDELNTQYNTCLSSTFSLANRSTVYLLKEIPTFLLY